MRFFARLIVGLLPTFLFAYIFISINRDCNHDIGQVALEVQIYSTSHEDISTTVYFLEHHKTGELINLNTYLIAFFLSLYLHTNLSHKK